MKNYSISIPLAGAALMLVLTGFSPNESTPADPVMSLGVFVNDKLLPAGKDSLAINAKGTLSIHALVNESPMAERMKFRMVIRHRNFAHGILLFPWDEKYNGGEPLQAIDLSKLLVSVRPGDQLVVMLSDSDTVNCLRQVVITVKGDGC